MTARVEDGVTELRQLDETLWEIPADARADMRVPARVFADRELLEAIRHDRSLEQLQNVAALPGIVEAALAMPDIHQGYGFPVGGVAATSVPDGVVSPGGVGYDINCGVRLLALPIDEEELGDRREPLVHELSRAIPAGTGKRSELRFSGAALDRLLVEGPQMLVSELGIGTGDDLEHTESGGCLPGADPAAVSERARARGADQVGTMGAGNHFVEVQRVERVFDTRTADAFGLRTGQVTVLIHSGSRGLGHQVCTDYVRSMDAAQRRYGIVLPDRQLACAPQSSPEGRAYLAAMAAAANYAWANRQAMAHNVRQAVRRILGEDHHSTLNSMSNLANALSMQKHYAEAQALLEETLEKDRRILGEDHPDTTRSRYNLACTAALRGDRSEALRWLEEAVTHGYDRPKSLLGDDDLRSLRGEPRFKAVAKRAQENADRPH